MGRYDRLRQIDVSNLGALLCAQMIVAGFATADDLVDEVKDIGPWSLEIREECKVVRQIVEGVDYVVCAEESGITWRGRE